MSYGESIVFPDNFEIPYSHIVLLDASDMYYSEWINPATSASRRADIWNARASESKKSEGIHESELSHFLFEYANNIHNAWQLSGKVDYASDPIGYYNDIVNRGFQPTRDAVLSKMDGTIGNANVLWIELCGVNMYTRCSAATSCETSHYNCTSMWSAIGYYPSIPSDLAYLFTTPVPPVPVCSDGTVAGACSSQKPKYCNNNGALIDYANICGCPEGQVPDPKSTYQFRGCVIGCPRIDSDADGVIDCNDQCPGGPPPGSQVSATGCFATLPPTTSTTVQYTQIVDTAFNSLTVKFKFMGIVELFNTDYVHYSPPPGEGLFVSIYDLQTSQMSPWLKIGDSYLLSSGVTVTITAISPAQANIITYDGGIGPCSFASGGSVCEKRYQTQASTITYSLSISPIPDSTPPLISNVQSFPEPVAQGSLVDFSAGISDASGISALASAQPTVCPVSDPACFGKPTRFCEMGRTNGTVYKCSHNTQGNAPGSYEYVISAKDPAGNLATSAAKTFTVTASSCAYSTMSSCEGVSACQWCNASSSCSQSETQFACLSDSSCGQANDSCVGGNWNDYNGDGKWNSASKVCFACTSCNNPTGNVRGKDQVWCSNCDPSAPLTVISPLSGTSWPAPQLVSLASSDECNATIYYSIDNGIANAYSGPFSGLAGGHNYTYWAVDGKGNAEARKTASITLNAAGNASTPNATLNASTPNATGNTSKVTAPPAASAKIITSTVAGTTIASVPITPGPDLLVVSGLVSVDTGKEQCLSEICQLDSVVLCINAGDRYYAKFRQQTIPKEAMLNISYQVKDGCKASDYTPGLMSYQKIGGMG